MRKTNRPWPECNQFQRWWGYISMLNFRLFLPCVLKKIPETPNFNCFTKSKWRQNEEYQYIVTKIQTVLEVVKIHRQAKCETIPPLCSQENARKSQIRPFSQSQNTTKMRKINRWWPKSNQFSRWSGYISMSNFRPFKVTAIKRINLTLMPPQRLSEKVQLQKKKKKMPKIQNCNLGQTRNICLTNHLEVSSWEISSCYSKNSDEESTFTLHGHKTKWAVKI